MDFDAAGRNVGGAEAKSDQASPSSLLRLSGAALLALLTANCAQQQQVAGGGSKIDPRYGVSPSPRVVADGEPVPKGGGRALVGKPYVIAGKTYVPNENPRYAREGLASWYGAEFHGRVTANGEVFDKESFAAAHPTMPLPSYARITNLYNNRSMVVRVNDRGPYHANRLIDVSQNAAEALDFRRAGTARVRVEYIGKASLAGSDDRILMASLRTDGGPASLPMSTPTMVAQATPRPVIPRESIAYRQPAEEDAQPALYRGPRQAPVQVAEASVPQARLVRNVTFPPERPYDLGTIPQAATPVRSAAVPRGIVQAALPPPRRQLTGLYFASPDQPEPSLSGDSPFQALRTEKVVSLRTKP